PSPPAGGVFGVGALRFILIFLLFFPSLGGSDLGLPLFFLLISGKMRGFPPVFPNSLCWYGWFFVFNITFLELKKRRR
ncbi:hypothetical protein ACQWF6_25435, partial [Salmonella enterica subsp. enterica serovar Infantis]